MTLGLTVPYKFFPSIDASCHMNQKPNGTSYFPAQKGTHFALSFTFYYNIAYVTPPNISKDYILYSNDPTMNTLLSL